MRERLRPRENWYRDVFIFVVLGISLYGVVQANSAVDKIQEQRVSNVREACAAQNEANARIETSLLRLVPKPTNQQSRAISTFADSIAPVENCRKVVKALTGETR